MKRFALLAFLALAGLSAASCGGEPKGTPVALDSAPAKRADLISAWSKKTNELLDVKPGAQSWAKPEGLPVTGRFAEALYAQNQEIALLRECWADPADDCKSIIEQKAENIAGGLGVGLMFKRQLCDSLSLKAQILLRMGHAKAALAVAEESIGLGPHPYNQKTKGDALYALGRFAEADAAYGEAVSAAGDYPRFLQGLCKMQSGDTAGGTKLIKDALAKKPNLRNDVPGASALLAGWGI